MANIAFIPVRGGSKSIPLKNIKELHGKPLLYWTAFAAQEASCIDKIVIATDCSKIKETALSFNFSKVVVYDRGAENAQDTSSTESVMLEYIMKEQLFQEDTFFLIQATSPLLQASYIEDMYNKMQSEKADSALSCVIQKRFFWTNEGSAINYDYQNRPRRQDFDGYLMENGACYINSVKNILQDKNRLSGKICVYEMPEYTAVEIDEEDDWIVLEQLMKKYTPNNETPFNCKMLLTDCDGVLTDGGMYYSENGDELKRFNTKDGMGVQLLREKGIKFGIITGEKSELVVRRAKKLKADECYIGISNKLEILDEICKKYNYDYSEIAYIGDDINDIEILKVVGFPCSVPNAMEEVKEYAKYITVSSGGSGAVREVAERVLTGL